MLPPAASLTGRTVVLDVAFASEGGGSSFEKVTLPFIEESVKAARELMGEDYWAYGLEANRPTWEAVGRYVHEQGLAPRVVTPEELFPVAVE